jgi:hypothetical protein
MRRMLRAPIFVVGLNKSGTSLLYLLMSRHRDVSGLRGDDGKKKSGSARLYLANYGLTEGHKLPGLPERLRPSDSSNLFAASSVLDRYRATENDVAPGEAQAAADAYLAAMIAPSQRLVEKSPPNLVRTRYIQGLFPDATFVAIVRDPYANVASNAKRHTKWGSVAEQAEHWSNAHTAFLDDRPHLKRCVTVRYEDLAADPEATLRRVCDVAGLDSDAGMIDGVSVDAALNDDLLALLTDDDRATISASISPPTAEVLGYAVDRVRTAHAAPGLGG